MKQYSEDWVNMFFQFTKMALISPNSVEELKLKGGYDLVERTFVEMTNRFQEEHKDANWEEVEDFNAVVWEFYYKHIGG